MHRASRIAIVNTDKTRAGEAFFNRTTSGSHAGKARIDRGTTSGVDL